MSMQQRGYICEKGRTHGNLVYISLMQGRCKYTHVRSSAVFSGENQLTLTTFSYSSKELMAMGM